MFCVAITIGSIALKLYVFLAHFIWYVLTKFQKYSTTAKKKLSQKLLITPYLRHPGPERPGPIPRRKYVIIGPNYSVLLFHVTC